MTNNTGTTTQTPKKSNKKLLVIVAIVLALLALDYFKLNYVLGEKEETPVVDSVNVSADTTQVATSAVVAIDTTKKDSTNK